jgi:hypothetical protein
MTHFTHTELALSIEEARGAPGFAPVVTAGLDGTPHAVPAGRRPDTELDPTGVGGRVA